MKNGDLFSEFGFNEIAAASGEIWARAENGELFQSPTGEVSLGRW
jgi:hypothetical protein